VAAIAAGVLINTAGFLQSQAEATGEESTSQVSDSLQIISATGTVTDDPVVDSASLRVGLAPGADGINLENAEVQLIGPGGADTYDIGTGGSGTQLSTTSDATLTESTDRETISFSTTELNDVSSDSASPDGLNAGDEIEVTISTASGGQTTTVLRVPDPLEGSGGAVSL
jgi:flagellin FlaB